MMGKQKRLEPKLFYPHVSMEARIPQNHLLRRIKEVIDFDFARSEVADLYGIRGNPSIDPAVLLKLMFLLFFEQVPSERALMEQMSYRLDWLWFCQYDLDETIPDHSVLSKARRRWGIDVFARFFQHVLRQCVEAGLVDGKLVYVDGCLIHADASMETLQPELQVVGKALYDQLEQATKDEEVSSDSNDNDDEGLSSPPSPPEDEKNDHTSTSSRPVFVSPTDPDARMTRKNGQTVLGHKEHRAVDDRCGIITATATTDASVDESHMLADVLNQHRWNTGMVESTVVADRGYGTRNVYRELYERGARPCIPHQQWGCSNNTFSTGRFIYDPKQDCYRCPAGHDLVRKGRRRKCQPGRPIRYYGDSLTCQNCPLRAKCTTNPQGRTIVRHPDQWYVEWADNCLPVSQRRRLQGRRRHLCEGSFADATNNHGYKRAHWRGGIWVEIQNLMIATTQNIRKYIRHGGDKGRGPATLRHILRFFSPYWGQEALFQVTERLITILRTILGRPASMCCIAHAQLN
jgi:transposase